MCVETSTTNIARMWFSHSSAKKHFFALEYVHMGSVNTAGCKSAVLKQFDTLAGRTHRVTEGVGNL